MRDGMHCPTIGTETEDEDMFSNTMFCDSPMRKYGAPGLLYMCCPPLRCQYEPCSHEGATAQVPIFPKGRKKSPTLPNALERWRQSKVH